MREPLRPAASSERRFGRYALLGTLGRGGMGEILRARSFGAGGATKDLCIKRIHEDRLRRPGARERFVDEARLSLRLSHANIVSVFDFGRVGDEHYLAMEWVDGADLRAVLDIEKVLPAAVAAHVAAEVARALAYAHDLGIVHCDVKPANVLIARTGDVKLADFGVATAMHDAVAGETRGYAPPEERAGAPATPSRDLWALGKTLEEMIGGRDDIDPALRDLLGSLLADAPDARPARAGDVARALEAFVARERAARGIVPRDELAERASRLAALRVETRVEGTLEPTESWAAETAATAPPSAPATRQPRTMARRAFAGAAITIVFAIGLTAALARREAPTAAPVVRVAPRPAPPAPAPSPEPPIAPAPDLEQPVTVAPLPPPPPRAHRARPRAAEPAVAPAPTAVVPGRLRINAIPWAEVHLDGRLLGTTPLLDVEVPPGTHTLRFVHPPLQLERERRFDVAEGERRDVVVELR